MKIKKRPIITVSGLHGVGKSVYAKEIAKRYGLRYLSSGAVFREYAKRLGLSLSELTNLANEDDKIDRYIDNFIIKEANKGNMVADGLLTGWVLKDKADIKFWFKASDSIRYQRIANRDKIPIEIAVKETRYREEIERLRFKKYYGIDISDLSIYDYVIDTTYLSINDVLLIVFRIIDSYLAAQSLSRMILNK